MTTELPSGTCLKIVKDGDGQYELYTRTNTFDGWLYIGRGTVEWVKGRMMSCLN